MKKLIALLILGPFLLAFQDTKTVDIRLRTESSRRGKEWRLKMVGTTRRLPDGVIVTLRIYRVVPKIRWADKQIRMERIDVPVIRKVYVNGSRFERSEKLENPGRLEVEAAFVPTDQENPHLPKTMKRNYRPYDKTFEVSAAETEPLLAAIGRDTDRLRELLASAGKLLQSISNLLDHPDRLKEESAGKMKDLNDQLTDVRAFVRTTSLRGSAGLLETLLADVYNTLGTGLSKEKKKPDKEGPQDGGTEHGSGKGEATSSLTGQGFSLADAQNYVRDILEVSRRETGLLILLEAQTLAAGIAESKGGKDWKRDRKKIKESLDALAKHDRKRRDDDAWPKAVDRQKTKESLADMIAAVLGLLEAEPEFERVRKGLAEFRKHLESPEADK